MPARMPGLRPLGLLRSPSQASQLLPDHYSLQGRCSTCGSGRAREHRRSRCHAPRWILRGHARSHRITTASKAAAVPVGAGSPANTGAAGASHRAGFFAGTPLPQDYHNLQGSRSTCGGMPANTGAAGAMHRVGFFAGMPAPTGPPQPSRQSHYLWERVHPRTPAQPVPATALDSSRARPLPQDYHNLQGSHSTCGSGHAREHRRSRCHTPCRILRGETRSRPALSMVIPCADPGLPQAAPRSACRHQPSCLPPANHHPLLRS